jgi:hypothetical protein
MEDSYVLTLSLSINRWCSTQFLDLCELPRKLSPNLEVRALRLFITFKDLRQVEELAAFVCDRLSALLLTWRRQARTLTFCHKAVGSGWTLVASIPN